jgi:hypothetical protein
LGFEHKASKKFSDTAFKDEAGLTISFEIMRMSCPVYGLTMKSMSEITRNHDKKHEPEL